MRRTKAFAWAVAAMLAASAAAGQEKERGSASTAERAGPGWIERGFARLERAIERLEAKLSGRGSTGMMEGCQDMMAGGGMMGDGMMGGSRPNERWRGPAQGR